MDFFGLVGLAGTFILGTLILLGLVVLGVFAYLIAYGIFWLIKALIFCLLVRIIWYPKKKYAVLVYSDSPNWKEYIETNWFPRVSLYAFVINWSKRNDCSWDTNRLAREIFLHRSGVRSRVEKAEEYNPMVIIFVPWWKPRVIRFWKAFKDFKHGKDYSLRKLEQELFETLDPKGNK